MKFIKLTRIFDNRPVWINAGFVVTVEPRREGVGSVVVPIGDGLDYDVRESPEDVLKLLDGILLPEIVPVPSASGLAPTPKDVSPDPEPRQEAPVARTDEPKKEVKKPRRRTAKSKEPADAPKSAEKKTVGRKVAKNPVVLELSDAQIARLAKLSPKSESKLKNTLLTQFHVADAVAAVMGLEAKGVLKRDGKRILWET